MWSELALELARALVPVLALGILAAVTLAANYVRERTRSVVVERAIGVAQAVVEAAVLEAKQQTVDALKKANGGWLTPEQQEDVKRAVMQAVQARLSEQLKDELRRVIDDVEAFLASLIEREVSRSKVQMRIEELASPKSLPA